MRYVHRPPTVGQAAPHDTARGHVTGRALFVDDIPPVRGELHVDFVGSPCASGRLRRVDLERAATIPGVVGLFTHQDVPGHNRFGGLVADEPFLAEDCVLYHHQPVVVIAAETREAAVRARQAVRLEVEAQPPVLTIDEAIRRESFIGSASRIGRGNFNQAWAESEHRLEGSLRIGGQEHLYFESQAAVAYPGESGQIRVHASTQNPSDLQAVIGRMLALGMHQVVCECTRLGGAFGGKETQAAIPALMAALVAQTTGRPARVVYTREDDMAATGKRHPFLSAWKAAVEKSGRLLGVRVDLYADGGCVTDLSLAVMERSMLHADNAYYLPHVEINGRVCRTNHPSNTAFRGFGAPQAVATIENIIEEIAIRLGLDAYEVRRMNCYGSAPRDVTPYGQPVRDNVLPEIFDRLVETSSYKSRLTSVKTFNRTSTSELKGIALTAVKFGIAFTKTFLNQANALVNVYTDGTVQVSTGATEMGQGVNTKICQLVADEFGLPTDRVRIMATSTEKNNNTSPSAASSSTDLNGSAAVDACEQIKRRLAGCAAGLLADSNDGLTRSSVSDIRFSSGAVFDAREPDQRVSFQELVKVAHQERLDLGARGFYATRGIEFDRETGQGTPFSYFVNGGAVAEVRIDRYTGDLTVERVDLLMDAGEMINPGVDRGQVVGGFVQGMGWVTTEELVYDVGGSLLSRSPATYKIPTVSDVPEAFHVAFLENDRNTQNIRGSKSVGEPPLLLAVSVWAAVKHALSFVRPGQVPRLAVPATGEQILSSMTDLLERTSGSGAIAQELADSVTSGGG